MWQKISQSDERNNKNRHAAWCMYLRLDVASVRIAEEFESVEGVLDTCVWLYVLHTRTCTVVANVKYLMAMVEKVM